MKKNNNFILNFSRFISVFVVLLAFVSCNTTAWDEHYDQHDMRLDANILTVLSENPEYTTFVKLLKETEYDKLLEVSQGFTVWAPNNAALALVPSDVLNNPVLLKELIGNHISRFSYNTSFSGNSIFVKMLNNKYIEFSKLNGTVQFGGVDLVEKDMLTSNGILHKLSQVLTVKPNIFAYINDKKTQFPILVDYLNQFNKKVFDEKNSVRIGTNSLGQAVYDSIFKNSNSQFNIIGDISSEEQRYTFIGLTDAVYANVYNTFKGYYNYPVADSIKMNTDKTIFKNLNFPQVALSALNGTPLTTTTGNKVTINASSVVESVPLSNGNLFVLNQLNYNPKDVIFKPVRYEIENTDRRTVGSLIDLAVVKKYDAFASGQFTNVISLNANPTATNTNNFFEIAFSNVLSAKYKINLKFSAVGAQQATKLKFEFSYVDAAKKTVVVQIPAIVVGNLEDGIITIGSTYTIPVFINNLKDNAYTVKLKVIVDVSEPELLLYGRRFGIDYAELIPVD